MLYNPNNSLPYDYSRCAGQKDHTTCSDCMRKLSPGRADGWGQSYIARIPLDNGECEYKISVKQWEERK